MPKPPRPTYQDILIEMGNHRLINLVEHMQEKHMAIPSSLLNDAKDAAQARTDSANFSITTTSYLDPDIVIEQLLPIDDVFNLVPLGDGVPPGATEIVLQRESVGGKPSYIAPGASSIPSIRSTLSDDPTPLSHTAVSYFYNQQDLDAASVRAVNGGGFNLVNQTAERAAEGIGLLHNLTVLNGVSKLAIPGLFNNPEITQVAVPSPWNNSGTTTEQIVKSVIDVIRTAREQTSGRLPIDTVVFGEFGWAQLANPRAGTTQSALAYLREAFEGTEFIRSTYLDDIQLSSAPGDTFLVYSRTAEAVKWYTPVALRELPPQQRGLNNEVYIESRFSRAIFRYPQSAVYGIGIKQ